MARCYRAGWLVPQPCRVHLGLHAAEHCQCQCTLLSSSVIVAGRSVDAMCIHLPVCQWALTEGLCRQPEAGRSGSNLRCLCQWPQW